MLVEATIPLIDIRRNSKPCETCTTHHRLLEKWSPNPSIFSQCLSCIASNLSRSKTQTLVGCLTLLAEQALIPRKVFSITPPNDYRPKGLNGPLRAPIEKKRRGKMLKTIGLINATNLFLLMVVTFFKKA